MKPSQKRQRESKTQGLTTYTKRGWTLPHGMGTAANSTSASVSSDSKYLDATATTPSNQQQPALRTTSRRAPPQKSGKNGATKPVRQTRLSFWLSKPGHPQQNGKEVTTEEGRLIKRTISAGEGATAGDSATVVNTESFVQEQPSSAFPSTRKLLLIQGVTMKNELATKTGKWKLKRDKENPYGLTTGYSPYPYRKVPTAEACEEVYRILADLHGEVKQPDKMLVASLEVAGCGKVPCVLDALLRTIISGNRLVAHANKAIKNLGERYGTRQTGTGAGSIDWEKVRLSSHNELMQIIRVAGSGSIKAKHIKQALDLVHEENVEMSKEQNMTTLDQRDSSPPHTLSFDHMHKMSKDEAIAKFVKFPGIGIKAAACVTLFCLRLPCFAVGTHVHKFCRWLSWVYDKAGPDTCFRHGEVMVPDHLKYGRHQLFIRHGQQCFKCRKATKPGIKD
ncbi:DNA glycosylase [Podospora didyma]|uniref:DNA glycosylase n=1 Tax=Podospora didyma TaxID=330526 RepID=A0AAE0U6R2_9PEZI|nr:DNA glycosylase [Podospora didyma]